jgi:AraC-like DNA-binding protein
MSRCAWKPTPALVPFIDEFSYREANLGTRRIYNPLPARSDCFLEFYFADRYRIVTVANGALHESPRAVLVGPHSRRREDLLLTGRLNVFSIRFTPVGFRAIFGIPAHLIGNSAESATVVLGSQIAELEDRLATVAHSTDRLEPGPSAWSAVAEAFLLKRLFRSDVAQDGGVVARIVRVLQQRHGAVSIAGLAASHNLSARQVERAFREHVGLSPKLFARVARLNQALRISRRDAGIEWADVASIAGYFDQSHMVRDFRELLGEPPVQFAALFQRGANLPSGGETARDVAFVLSPSAGASIASHP